jgi:hypothetical protein
MLFWKVHWPSTDYKELYEYLRRYRTPLFPRKLVVNISCNSGQCLSCLESVGSWSCKRRFFEQYLLLKPLKEQWIDCALPMISLYFFQWKYNEIYFLFWRDLFIPATGLE